MGKPIVSVSISRHFEFEYKIGNLCKRRILSKDNSGWIKLYCALQVYFYEPYKTRMVMLLDQY